MELYAGLLAVALFVTLFYLSLSIFTGRAPVNTEKSRFDKAMVLLLLLIPSFEFGSGAFELFSGLFETGFEGVVFDVKTCIALFVALIPLFIVVNKFRHKVNHTNESYPVVNETGYFSVAENCKAERYISVEINDIDLVSQAKRIFFAEVTPDDGTVTNAAKRINEECLSGGYDLVVVKTGSIDCALLRVRLDKDLKGIPVIAGRVTSSPSKTSIVPVD